ncbi:hypothetical protein [Nocardioides nanhaiensis]|uniref:DUF222 domain-containing protein n=1 Tax=Nocardioides nanhaiensis TaxID=1476871 RepID=A0ABP8VSJ1_9ACTN
MSIDTWVEGSPGPCRESARRLQQLAGTVQHGEQLLAAQALPGRAGFEGMAAQAYRARCTGLALAARRLGEQLELLAGALLVLADDLADLRSLMSRVRAVARGRLGVEGWVVQAPTADAEPEQRALYRRLHTIAAKGRALEDAAQRRYRAALSGATGLPPAQEAGFASPVTSAPTVPSLPPDEAPRSPTEDPPAPSAPSAPPQDREPDRVANPEPGRDRGRHPVAAAHRATPAPGGERPATEPPSPRASGPRILSGLAAGSLPVLTATVAGLHRRLDTLLTHEEVTRDDEHGTPA